MPVGQEPVFAQLDSIVTRQMVFAQDVTLPVSDVLDLRQLSALHVTLPLFSLMGSVNVRMALTASPLLRLPVQHAIAHVSPAKDQSPPTAQAVKHHRLSLQAEFVASVTRIAMRAQDPTQQIALAAAQEQHSQPMVVVNVKKVSTNPP